jgi:hypothetical protein
MGMSVLTPVLCSLEQYSFISPEIRCVDPLTWFFKKFVLPFLHFYANFSICFLNSVFRRSCLGFYCGCIECTHFWRNLYLNNIHLTTLDLCLVLLHSFKEVALLFAPIAHSTPKTERVHVCEI